MSSHHQLIRRLVARIRDLEHDQHTCMEELTYARERADRLGDELHDAHYDARRAQEDARQEEQARWWRDNDRQRALNDLERARLYQDEHSQARALARLKSL